MKILSLFALFTIATCDSEQDVLKPANFIEVSKMENIQPSISGGTPAVLGQFPYQAAIYSNYEGKDFVCGGALIKHKWVLTAATCVTSLFTNIVVKLGTVESYAGFNAFTSKTISSDNIIIHPDLEIIGYQKNIALVYVEDMPSDILDSPYVDTIDLPNDSEVYLSYVGYTGTISGYGTTTSFSNVTDGILRSATTLIEQNYFCTVLIQHTVTKNSLCVYSSQGKSICGGDQGSPMVISSSSNRKFLLGIANVPVLGCEELPALFESVAAHRDWILNTINGSSMIQKNVGVAAMTLILILKNFL